MKQADKKYKKIGGEIGFSYLLLSAQILLAPLIVALLTRILGVEKYGIYVLFSALIGLFSVLLEPGLSQYLISKLPSVKKKKWSRIFFSLIFFEVMLSLTVLVIFYFSPIARAFLEINKLGGYSSLLAIIMVIIFFGTIGKLYDYYYKTKQRLNLANFMEFLRLKGWILPLFVIFLLFGKFDLSQVFLIYGIFVFIAVLSYFWITRTELFAFFRQGGMQYKFIKPAIVFGLPLISANILAWLIAMSDRYILNFYTSASVVGLYSLAYSLPAVVLTIGITVSSVIWPYFSEAWWKGKNQHNALLNASLKYGLIVILPALAGIFILRSEIITLISGPQFLAAVPVIIPLLPFPLFVFISNLFSQVLFLTQQTKFVGFVTLSGGILNIGLNIWLIPIYGMFGAAISTVLSYLFVVMFIFYRARKYVSINYKFIKIPHILVSVIVMGIIVSFMHPIGFLSKILTIMMGAILYFAMLFLTKVFNESELKIIKSFLSRKSRK